MIYKSFIQKISGQIKNKKLTLRTVSKFAGIDVSYLSKILSGKRNPPYEEKVIVKLSQILGIDADELLFSAGKIPQKYQHYFSNPKFVRNVLSLLSSSQMSENEILSKKKLYRKKVKYEPVTIKKEEISDELL